MRRGLLLDGQTDYRSRRMATRPRAWYVVALFVAVAAAPPPAAAQRLSVRAYGVEDGLPSTEVACIVPDRKGFVWFCTSEGLARFDGATFKSYREADGLTQRRVTAFLEDRDGSYWVGTAGGLWHFDPEARVAGRAGRSGPVFQAVRGDDPAAPAGQLTRSVFPVLRSPTYALHQDAAGVVWCGTGAGVYRVVRARSGHRLESAGLTIRQPNAVQALLADRRGRLWIGAGSGLYRLDRDGGLVDFGDEGFLEPGANHNVIASLLESSDGRVWVGTENAGLRLLASEAEPGAHAWTRKWVDATGVRHDRAARVIQSSDGTIWWVGLQGLRSLRVGVDGTWDDSTLDRFGVANGLPGLSFDQIAEDASGDLWLAGPAGVARITRRGFTTFTEADGLDTRAVRAITIGGDGNVVVETGRARGAWFHNRFDGRQFLPVRFNIPHDDWGWGWSQLTFQDAQGRWWLPTGQAVYRSPAGVPFAALRSAHFFKFPSPFPPQPFLRAGRLVTDLSGRPPEVDAWAAFRLFADSSGYVWAGTMQRVGGHETPNELVRWDPATDRFSTFANNDRDFVPMSFAEDRAGGVWIGGYNGGLRRAARGSAHLQDYSALVPPGQVTALLVDTKGMLWAGIGDQGVVRIESPDGLPIASRRYGVEDGLASLNVSSFVEDATGRVYVGHARGVDVVGLTGVIERGYTSADGLAPGPVWCAARDQAGALWFGTLSGVSRLLPQAGTPSALRMRITGIDVGGQPIGVGDIGEQVVAPFQVSSDAPVVRITYAAFGSGAPFGVRYEVQLEGGADAWGPPTQQQAAEFTRLAAGSYRFMVRAVSPGGVALSEAAVVPFTVLRPFWLRWWFLTAMALSAAGLLLALHRLRLARAVAVERVRLQLARDLHDELGASLSRLAILSDVAQRDHGRVAAVLADVSTTSRRLVDALGEVVWLVDPRKDDLSSVMSVVAAHGRDLFEPQGVEWICEIPRDAHAVQLRAEVRRELYLLLKEAVTNAAKHAACRRAGVSVTREAGRVVLEVWDEGRGFGSLPSAAPADGNGLPNMRARAQAMGATMTVLSQPGDTRIRVTLPF